MPTAVTFEQDRLSKVPLSLKDFSCRHFLHREIPSFRGFPQALSTIEDVVAHFRRMQETDCPSGDEASPGHLRN